jgi:hypothetical protein
MIDGNRNINWGPIRLTGLHAITSEQTKTIQVAINAPVEESTIASVEQISIGATKVTSSNSSGTSFIQLWPWALGAVLFVLLAEWWVYQKKVSTPLRTSWSQTQLEERGFR